VNDSLHEIQSFPPAVKGVLWDQKMIEEVRQICYILQNFAQSCD